MEVPAENDNKPKVSRYRVVHVAARRARQLQSGSSPSVPVRSIKAVRIAQDEMAAGLVDYVVPDESAEKKMNLPDGYTPILHT